MRFRRTRPPACFCRGETQDDRQDTGGREQTTNGQRQHGNQHNQYRGGVDRGGGEIRKEPSLAPSAVMVERERHARNEHSRAEKPPYTGYRMQPCNDAASAAPPLSGKGGV